MKFNKKSYIFIQENTFEKVICKMAAIWLVLNVLSWCGQMMSYGIIGLCLTAPSHYLILCWYIGNCILRNKLQILTIVTFFKNKIRLKMSANCQPSCSVCCSGLFVFQLHVSAHTTISLLNALRHGQNGWLFADDIFKCISLNENHCVLIQISLKFVPK